jgi:hypothetical protein
MNVEFFAVVRSQGLSRGRPVTGSSSAACAGAASEAVAQSRRLAM